MNFWSRIKVLIFGSDLPDPGTTHIALGAKADGLYIRKPGGTDKRLLTEDDSGGSYTHPIYDPVEIALSGAEVISQITTDEIGSVQHIGTRQLLPGEIGAATNNHSHDYDNYVAWKALFEGDVSFLVHKDGSSAAVNAIAFTNAGGIQLWPELVGNTLYIGFENTQRFYFIKLESGLTSFELYDQETLKLIAGSNVTITPNAVNKSVTISAASGDNYEAWAFDINGGGSVLIYKNASGSTYQGVRLLAGDGINILASSAADKFSVATIENTKPFDQFNVKVGGAQAFAVLNLEALNLIAGSNVTITPNAVNKSVTISAASGDNYEAWAFDINGGGSVLIYKNASGSTYQGVRLLAGDGINILASSAADKFSVATIENTKPFDQFNVKVGGAQAFAVLNLEALNLIAGSNVTITPNAGNKSVTIDAASGSARTYKRAALIESDFYHASTVAVPGITGAAVSSGTVIAIAGERNHPGVVCIRDSATANGGYNYLTDMSAFKHDHISPTGTQYYEAALIFKMTTVTSTTKLRFGFLNSASVGVNPSQGYYMETICDGTNFISRLICYNGGVFIGSSQVAYNHAANTWYRAVLKTEHGASGILVTLQTYSEAGALLTTTTLVNMPQMSAAHAFGVQAGETTTSATANLTHLDYIKLDGLIELTR